jgi:hypothetical protein
VALDGCPRGREQALLFLETGCLASQALMVELRFDFDVFACSLERR